MYAYLVFASDSAVFFEPIQIPYHVCPIW